LTARVSVIETQQLLCHFRTKTKSRRCDWCSGSVDHTFIVECWHVCADWFVI